MTLGVVPDIDGVDDFVGSDAIGVVDARIGLALSAFLHDRDAIDDGAGIDDGD